MSCRAAPSQAPVKNDSAGALPSESLTFEILCNVLPNRLGFFSL